jgi:predicted transcriptional regulator
VIRRNTLTTAMEVLAALREGPLSPSRLAQRCNINYGRLGDVLEPLEANGWIAKEGDDHNQEALTLTKDGLQTYLRYESLWNEYQSGVRLTSRPEGF